MTLAWSLIAIAVSIVALVVLGIADPKRRRTLKLTAAPRPRALLVLLALAPGAALALTGQPAAFLIWLGGAGVGGWAVSAALNGRTPVRD